MGEKQIKRAKLILNYCKQKKKRYFTTKNGTGKIMEPDTNKPYGAHELGAGIKILNKNGNIIRVSKNRYEILSYELK
jgi:hypothetical protein